MANLFIVAASYQRIADQQANALNDAFRSLPEIERRGSIVLRPAGVAFDDALGARGIPYTGPIGLEHGQATWQPWQHTQFNRIFVLGLDPLTDFQEIVLACFLKAFQKVFVGLHGTHDLARWEAQMRPDMAPRPVELRRLSDAEQTDHIRSVNRWLGTELIRTDYKLPKAMNQPSPDTLFYTHHRLAIDLAQMTGELQHEAHGASFSVLRCLDGSVVQSADYYRAIANFVGAVDGLESVLDVGCGSGFLACHLAASGRYKEVIGVDGTNQRIEGAQLHAQLIGSSARFERTSMSSIALPDKSVDVTVTSYALEQSGAQLAGCIAEIRRVTRKMMILFEPNSEFFSTVPGMWHMQIYGWANTYHAVLAQSGLAFAVRPSLMSQYYNPGAIFVIDLESREHPCLRFPQLFRPALEDWPGGVTLL